MIIAAGRTLIVVVAGTEGLMGSADVVMAAALVGPRHGIVE